MSVFHVNFVAGIKLLCLHAIIVFAIVYLSNISQFVMYACTCVNDPQGKGNGPNKNILLVCNLITIGPT